ncbi:MAG: aspartate/glutamate racemase family protein, partial [Chloroflexota bacterium]
MKIWCQLPVKLPLPEYQSFYDLVRTNYEMVKRPDTEIAVRDVPTGMPSGVADYLGLRPIHDRELLKSMLRAEKEGCDAVVGACFFDGAILAAGNLMDIPVVPIAETAMHLARIMGSRFAIVTTRPRYVPIMEAHLQEVNMRLFAIEPHPVRHLARGENFSPPRKPGDEGPFIEDFRNTARECIRDGAEVIIVGCGA